MQSMFISDILHKSKGETGDKKKDDDPSHTKSSIMSAAPGASQLPNKTDETTPILQTQVVVTQQALTDEAELNKKPRPTQKSKKKKHVPAGENTGRWTAEEHRLFLQGLEQHGKGWKKIAGLIKSRTVVQIRTHAQKYFQKLAKARQNGEDGDICLEPTGASSAVPPMVAPKRRRLVGTKRKPIQSVVTSALRQGKKLAAAQVASGIPDPMAPLPAISPVLSHFVLSSTFKNDDELPPPGAVSGQELEDAIFRFLSPCPPADAIVKEVARPAGADPIAVPNGTNGPSSGGEASPTGVNDLVSIYPPWTDMKDPPDWYAKGDDIHALLDVADTVDWQVDTGGDDDGYEPPPVESISLSSLKHSPSGSSMLEDHLQVFDTPIEEQAFVSTILSSDINLPASADD